LIRCAAFLVAALLPAPALACAWPAPELGGTQNAATRALEEKVAGEPLAARMRRHKVPGVGVALIRRGTLAWARGWGVRDAATCAPVTAATAFQAASISKTVAALTVVRLADRGALDLDADVARYLKRWRGPPGLTLRTLLGHTAGLNVHGFPGYPQGASLPTLPQILDGTPPANTEAVRPATPPGAFSYSGGGYEVAELAVTDAIGPYPALAEAEVLRPLGMTASGFTAPAEAARGHVAGQVVAGGWHLYPEAAAAGLWTTPADLARLLGSLDREEAREMIVRTSPGYGLGLEIAGEGATLRFGHRGSNLGYRALAMIFAETGDGVVVMTNGEEGGPLAAEIAAALAASQGWPASDF
jgi:CubicO group peptidase (beta-lactamase class C family)